MTKELLNVILKLHKVNGNVKCKKKVRESPNVRKELSHVMLELHNMRIKSSNVRKKKREPSNVRKELSHVMFKFTQCEDETVKCEKKVSEPPNVIKELSHVTKIE